MGSADCAFWTCTLTAGMQRAPRRIPGQTMGITGDVSGFLSTHLRRADQYNREAEKAERRLSEWSLTMALESYRTAVRLYSSMKHSVWSRPAGCSSVSESFARLSMRQRLRINQATDRPYTRWCQSGWLQLFLASR